MRSSLEQVTQGSFAKQVESSPEPFLVEFTSPWCAPCAALEPILEELAVENEGRIRIGRLNIAEHGEVCERFGVQSTPTMILFTDGKPVRRLIGAKNKRNLTEALREYLG